MRTTPDDRTADPAIVLRDAGLTYGTRALWQHLDLDRGTRRVRRGAGSQRQRQDLADPGAAGADRAVVGFGTGVRGRAPPRQQLDRLRPAAEGLRPRPAGPRRRSGRLGLDGHRWGVGLPNAGAAVGWRPRSRRSAPPRSRTHRSDGARAASSSGCASPRRCVGDPGLLLCDEPLLSLDLKHQREVVDRARPAPARRAAPPSCSSPTRSTRSCRSSTGCSTWSAAGGPSAPPTTS